MLRIEKRIGTQVVHRIRSGMRGQNGLNLRGYIRRYPSVLHARVQNPLIISISHRTVSLRDCDEARKGGVIDRYHTAGDVSH